ncbi:hypothetical protein E2C01_000333 [Portunus trituberculatus]|uniref:Uncharacterized protein n=1 Tax=Portunus trituberculatus TaxID=210409 RepID=A0A5B7CGZ1_PORTR|nr:hypothetical protein [Portunus trituberculatus]
MGLLSTPGQARPSVIIVSVQCIISCRDYIAYRIFEIFPPVLPPPRIFSPGARIGQFLLEL